MADGCVKWQLNAYKIAHKEVYQGLSDEEKDNHRAALEARNKAKEPAPIGKAKQGRLALADINASISLMIATVSNTTNNV